ncbi:MAG: hypothetical protein ABIL09_19780 [Gemmatimonadota bacterium]
MTMARAAVFVLVMQLVAGCAGGYWARQEAHFGVAGTCERCAPVTGTIASDQVNGPIEPRLYGLTGALVRTAAGDRVKADSVRFNGATGAFESAEMKGYILDGEVVIYTRQAPMQVTAKRAKFGRIGEEYVDVELIRGGTAIRAHRARVIWVQ